MENAEAPERLVIYGGIGKCARNWESYHAIVDALLNLENDETLAIQSGMPVAIFKTHRLAPRVVMANTNIMKATWPVFYDLQDKNLTMFAQYTAAPWEYIGTQGVIQGTFETLGAIGEQHFGGSLVGRILFTAGLGGMGANQPRAMTMHGGVCLVVDANPDIIPTRIAKKFLDVQVDTLEEGDRAGREGQGRRPGAGDRPARQRGRPLPARAGARLEARHRHRDVPLPRPDLLHRRRPHRRRGRSRAPGRPRRLPGGGARVDEAAAGRHDRLQRARRAGLRVRHQHPQGVSRRGHAGRAGDEHPRLRRRLHPAALH